MRQSDPLLVTIVGGGIIGICTGLSLIEAGMKVRLIDQDKPGQGASHGNAGIISPWSVVPQSLPGLWRSIPKWLLQTDGPVSVRWRYAHRLLPWALRFLAQGRPDRVYESAQAMDTLNHFNVDLYRKHLSGTGHENLIRDSDYVHAFRDASKATLESLDYKIRAEYGAPMERIDGDELHRREPALSPDFKAAIIIKGQARAMSPGRIGQVLAEKLRSSGGEIIQAKVVDMHPDELGSWVIGTDQQTYNSDKVVLAAGAWSAGLLESLGIRIPLEAERGYHVEFTNPGIALNDSVMDMDYKFVASSMEDGLRAAGTAEFAGLGAPMNKKRVQNIKNITLKMLPELNAEPTTTWMGVRPSISDGLPAIGEFNQHKGLFAAFGHSHYGLMMAPKTGDIVASLITQNPLNLDVSPFAPDRFKT